MHFVVMRAFGMLKMRQQLLYKKVERKLRILKTTVIAAFVGHLHRAWRSICQRLEH